MRKLLCFLMLLATIPAYAPADRFLPLLRPEPINPYENIYKAVCAVESSNNAMAYHMEENGFASIGIAQIQNSRIIDFNARTGHNYTLVDMYQPSKAKVVFMHYASEINPNNLERISREWNGGPSGMSKKSTMEYWLLIQKAL